MPQLRRRNAPKRRSALPAASARAATGSPPLGRVHPVRAHRRDRLDILVRGHDRPAAAPKCHQGAEQRSPLFGWQILLAQAEPPAPAGERSLDDLLVAAAEPGGDRR